MCVVKRPSTAIPPHVCQHVTCNYGWISFDIHNDLPAYRILATFMRFYILEFSCRYHYDI